MDTQNRLPFTDEQQRILTLALRHYGWEAQLRQTQEEAAQLIVAISHYLRADERDKTLSPITEVTADVLIMLQQILKRLPPPEIEKAINYKINRQRDRLREDIDAKYGLKTIAPILNTSQDGNN